MQGRDRKHVVGIDVSKDRLDVHVRPCGLLKAGLVERLRALAPVLVVMEAISGYESVVASAIAAAHLTLAVVNPRQIRNFARATGKLARTDRLDAAAIAHFAEAIRKARPGRPMPRCARR